MENNEWIMKLANTIYFYYYYDYLESANMCCYPVFILNVQDQKI